MLCCTAGLAPCIQHSGFFPMSTLYTGFCVFDCILAHQTVLPIQIYFLQRLFQPITILAFSTAVPHTTFSRQIISIAGLQPIWDTSLSLIAMRRISHYTLHLSSRHPTLSCYGHSEYLLLRQPARTATFFSIDMGHPDVCLSTTSASGISECSILLTRHRKPPRRELPELDLPLICGDR